MENSSKCLGCRTFFEQNQSLPLESMTVEYKNFNIPLQEQKHKWTILKTIISFLNTKGGTIYIGIEDNNCKVVGKQLANKARDEFKLSLLQLTERIFPQIDLINKQQLSVQYIPVVKNKSFSGKYVTKICVKQGDPCMSYCFIQKVQMINQGKKQNQQQQALEIVYSFVRHNMGGARQLKGIKLVEEAMKKAQNPPPRFNTFHEECNPQPVSLQVEIKKIGFKNLGNRQSRRKQQKVFKQYLEKLGGQYIIAFDSELKAVIIQLPTVDQFNKVNNFISANLSFLNESQNEVRFVDAGDYLDIHFYQNTLQQQKENGTPVKQKSLAANKPQKIQKKNDFKYIEQKTEVSKQYSFRERQEEESKFALTVTHINPNLKQNLQNYLSLSISKKIDLNCKIYQNTIMVFFDTKSDLTKYFTSCCQPNNLKALQAFGFNKQIKMGINTGHLHILNYDKNKENKIVYFLRSTMGTELKEIQVLKRGNRYVIDCLMKERNAVCEWLDKLLNNKELKQFRIPGAQNGDAPKMKIFIECEENK